MKIRLHAYLLALLLAFPADSAFAQTAVAANPDQQRLLQGSDWRTTANKRRVCDFWRIVLEAGHAEYAPMYMAKDYIQHNPTVAKGRDAFLQFLIAFVKPQPIQPRVHCRWWRSLPRATT
jgi:hypothetical protein